MRIIDKNEIMTWLSEKRLIDSNGVLSFSGFLSPLRFMIPVDSGKKTALSKTIVSLFDAKDEALLWINEFGIWPSCEDRYLFAGFRKSLGEYSPLHEKPGHFFSNKDLDAVSSLIAMTLYFCWGAIIISTANNFIIKISHDEVLYLYAREKECLSKMQESLTKILIFTPSPPSPQTPSHQ